MVEQRILDRDMAPRLAEIERLQEIEIGGETHLHDEVIAAIAGVAVREVEGISTLGTASFRRTVSEGVGGADHRARGVEVEAGRKEATLDLQLRVVYGFSIPEAVVKVRRNVAHRVLELCGMITKEINIDVAGIDFPDRMRGRVE